jgi:hypothetical protein
MVVVGETMDMTRALMPEKPVTTTAVPAGQWTVAVKHVEDCAGYWM